MANFDVRVFRVPRLAMGVRFNAMNHQPVEVDPIVVSGATIAAARRTLIEKLKQLKEQVRSVNVGPNAAGLPSFIVYLHGDLIQ